MNADGYTYASHQATECASCGEHKHTPLRRDEMGGYVCLTCIDRRLDALDKVIGDFARIENIATLTRASDRISDLMAAEKGTAEIFELGVLADLVVEHEERHSNDAGFSAIEAALEEHRDHREFLKAERVRISAVLARSQRLMEENVKSSEALNAQLDCLIGMVEGAVTERKAS